MRIYNDIFDGDIEKFIENEGWNEELVWNHKKFAVSYNSDTKKHFLYFDETDYDQSDEPDIDYFRFEDSHYMRALMEWGASKGLWLEALHFAFMESDESVRRHFLSFSDVKKDLMAILLLDNEQLAIKRITLKQLKECERKAELLLNV